MDYHLHKNSHYHIKHAEMDAYKAMQTGDLLLFKESMDKIKEFFTQSDSREEATQSFIKILNKATYDAKEAIQQGDVILFKDRMEKIKEFFSQNESHDKAIENFKDILSILAPNYKNFLRDSSEDVEVLRGLSLEKIFALNSVRNNQQAIKIPS